VNDPTPVSRERVLEQLERMLGRSLFQGAARSAALLRFLVAETLAGRAAYLKEYALGAQALERGADFDPRSDPIARVEASRLRSRLELYFATEGRDDRVVISLPKGSYVPSFTERSGNSTSTAPRLIERWSRPTLGWLAVALVALLAAGAVALWKGYGPPVLQAHVLRVDVALGTEGTLASDVGSSLALSPDGLKLALLIQEPRGGTRLYLRRLDELTATPLAGTVGARGPFFSPDGRWLGFWVDGKLKKILTEGNGSPITVCDATDLLGASWTSDNSIVATLNTSRGLWRIPSEGGPPIPILDLSKQGLDVRWAEVLPGSKAVLFTASAGSFADSEIDVAQLDGSGRKTLVRGGTYGRYAGNGYLIYLDRGSLFAVRFDPLRLQVQGAPFAVANGIDYSPGFGYANFDIAQNGTLIYAPAAASGLSTIRLLDQSNGSTALVDEPGSYLWPRLSPDGTRLAFSILSGSDFDISIYDIRTHRTMRFAAGPGDQIAPVWSSDGRFIAYFDSRARNVMALRSDGLGEAVPLLSAGIRIPWTFSPASARLAFHEMSPDTGFDLWTVEIREDAVGLHAGRPEPFRRTRTFETYPTFSPDGRWIAFGSDESGSWEVYVRAFPDNGSQVRVSSHGGRIPAWSHTGNWLFYETEQHDLMFSSYEVRDGRFISDEPHLWSTIQLADTGVLGNFDVAPDGKHVVGLVAAESPAEPQRRDHITLVSNFFDAVRKIEAR
jgi:Tol biopolymer transport system component